MTLRLKSTIRQRTSTGVALGLDIRLPTGDELNLLGTGSPGLQPFAIVSATYQKISLHGNAGYQWNGSSIIAGNPAAGTSADFPDQVTYSLGADVSAHARLTLAFDVLGRRVIDAERLSAEEFHALDGRSVYPSIVFSRQSFNALSGAVGVNCKEQYLFTKSLDFAFSKRSLAVVVLSLSEADSGKQRTIRLSTLMAASLGAVCRDCHARADTKPKFKDLWLD